MKDEEKRAALFEATVRTVNDVGFVAASVSKIAKAAKVSPATLYVYYENKEDLLVSAYIEIKKNLSRSILKSFDPNLPIRDILRNVWWDLSDHIAKHNEQFHFAEQFTNSPYHDLVNREAVEGFFMPIIEVVQRGIEEKIIKDVEFDILAVFIFHTAAMLSNHRFCRDFKPTPDNIETAFNLAWDAIKL